MRHPIKRIMLILLGTILILVGAIVAMAFVLQDRLIYYPRPYPTDPSTILPAETIVLEYETSSGRQTQFYLPPTSGKRPERIWLLFGGNASLALGWLDFVLAHRSATDGYLLLDYPGYGRCAGSPHPDAILESATRATELLFARMEGPVPPLALLGHSLGSAVALHFAARTSHTIERIILLSPFTSLRRMARLAVGPLHVLLRHDYDNRARLNEILSRNDVPLVTIFHGEKDEIIPVAMGRHLARDGRNRVRYVEIPGAGHNDIIALAAERIAAAMRSVRNS